MQDGAAQGVVGVGSGLGLQLPEQVQTRSMGAVVGLPVGEVEAQAHVTELVAAAQAGDTGLLQHGACTRRILGPQRLHGLHDAVHVEAVLRMGAA